MYNNSCLDLNCTKEHHAARRPQFHTIIPISHTHSNSSNLPSVSASNMSLPLLSSTIAARTPTPTAPCLTHRTTHLSISSHPNLPQPSQYARFFTLISLHRSCAMLCYAVLCCAMLCYAMLCYGYSCLLLFGGEGWEVRMGTVSGREISMPFFVLSSSISVLVPLVRPRLDST